MYSNIFLFNNIILLILMTEKWQKIAALNNEMGTRDTILIYRIQSLYLRNDKKSNCLESYPSSLYILYIYKYIWSKNNGCVKPFPPSLPILRSDCQTKISIFNVSTVIPNPRIQQYNVRRVNDKLKRRAFAVAFRRRSYVPCFITYYLGLPHESRYIIQLKKKERKRIENIYKRVI